MEYYKVIKVDGMLESLEEEVNAAIKEGWVPVGGINTIFTSYGANGRIYYLQAMTQNLNK